jgi:translocation and assembly module TamA
LNALPDPLRPTLLVRAAHGLRFVAVLVALLWAHGAAAGINLQLDIHDGNARMETNIRSYLSLTRYAERNDLDSEVMERLTDRIPGEVAKAMEPLGYYQSVATFEFMQVDAIKNDWRVRIQVTPGPVVRFSRVNIVILGEGRDDARIATERDSNGIEVGEPLDHGVYDAAKNNLVRAANNSGYLDAHYQQSDLTIDREARTASVDLLLDTGERYYFGDITIEQDVINADVMQRLLRMKRGDPYQLDLLLQTQYVLDDTSYFLGAEVESGTPDPVTHTVPVTIRAKPNLRNRYSIAAGYGTDTQARGTLTWDRRLVNREGHRAKLELTGSAVGYEASARYVVPVRDVALEKLDFLLSDIKEELADAVSYRAEFTPSYTQVLGAWQRVLYLKFSHERSVYPDRTDKTFLIIPGIKYETLPTYILGQTQRRYAFSAELSGSPSSLGSGASFIQLRLNGEKVFDLSAAWHLRLKGQLGASWITDKGFTDLPASVRFFAGGDNSVRGFALNELSPVDADGKKVGARNLLVGTVEVERDLPRNLRLATFYDVGNAIDHFGDRLEHSAGVGLRWHVSVASLGLDLAKPLSEPGRGVRLHLYLSTLF